MTRLAPKAQCLDDGDNAGDDWRRAKMTGSPGTVGLQSAYARAAGCGGKEDGCQALGKSASTFAFVPLCLLKKFSKHIPCLSKHGVLIMSDETPQSKGGKRRAEKLTPEERKHIARQGAIARWSSQAGAGSEPVPKVIVTGVLRVGNIPCAVLDDKDNTRVLTQAGFLTAIGRAPTPKSASGSDFADLPAFLRAKNLEPFIGNGLAASSIPIVFETERRGNAGGGRALGYKAQLLPDVCWVYAKAHMAGKLLSSQKHIAEACLTLLEALTNVAIDALVDEATGFQDMRAKDALIRLLEKYVSKEAFPWVRTFDSEFYKEMHRLHGYEYDPSSMKRPLIFARRTEDIYNRLAPGVRKELQRVVKRGKSGRPSEKLFTHLTETEGYRRLQELLVACKALMKISDTYADYERKLDKAFPRFGDTLPLPFDEQ